MQQLLLSSLSSSLSSSLLLLQLQLLSPHYSRESGRRAWARVLLAEKRLAKS